MSGRIFIKTLNAKTMFIGPKSTGPTGGGEDEDSSYWGQVVTALENCSPSDFDMTNLTYVGSDTVLTQLQVGSTVDDVKYKFDADSDNYTTDITWKILGYNATAPEYVKYKDASGNKVYVKSTKNDLLAGITTGDNVYTRTYDEITMDHSYTEAGTIDSTDGEFYYGNNSNAQVDSETIDNRYAVPMTIVVGGTTYTFCGYNMTMQTEHLINDYSVNDNYYMTLPWWRTDFDYNNGDLKNIWSQSNIRSWLNRSDYECTAKSYSTLWGNGSEFTSKSFISRMTSDYGFMKNVQKVVNKTWIYYDTDHDFRTGLTLDNNCEHTVDKFWLLDSGQLNMYSTGDYHIDALVDKFYSISKFSSVYTGTDNSSEAEIPRIKFASNINGSGGVTSSACNWWLRSASSGNYYYVGGVYYYGCVGGSNYVYDYYHGVSPACTIG